MYRHRGEAIEVFLVHPGGPFWAKKDLGAWSLPKGEIGQGENPLAAAQREFKEETGFDIDGNFISLGSIKQAGGKTVMAWAVPGDCDPAVLKSNTFKMEWPSRSGEQKEFPEADRGAWFGLEAAKQKIISGQIGFLEGLAGTLAFLES